MVTPPLETSSVIITATVNLAPQQLTDPVGATKLPGSKYPVTFLPLELKELVTDDTSV